MGSFVYANVQKFAAHLVGVCERGGILETKGNIAL